MHRLYHPLSSEWASEIGYIVLEPVRMRYYSFMLDSITAIGKPFEVLTQEVSIFNSKSCT